MGAANGQNPLAIVIPCHRVISSTGKLIGYAGGLDIKQALLAFEHRHNAQGKGHTRLPRCLEQYAMACTAGTRLWSAPAMLAP